MTNIELLAGSDRATATTANRLRSFDGIQIACHDRGEGPAVILLHGFGAVGWTNSEVSGRILALSTIVISATKPLVRTIAPDEDLSDKGL